MSQNDIHDEGSTESHVDTELPRKLEDGGDRYEFAGELGGEKPMPAAYGAEAARAMDTAAGEEAPADPADSKTPAATAAVDANNKLDDAFAGLDRNDTEFSAERYTYAAPPRLVNPEEERPTFGARSADDDAPQAGQITGWIALILAIASLFVWPSVLGPAAVVVGFMAYAQGKKAFGTWSIVLGLISFVTFLVLLRYYA